MIKADIRKHRTREVYDGGWDQGFGAGQIRNWLSATMELAELPQVNYSLCLFFNFQFYKKGIIIVPALSSG